MLDSSMYNVVFQALHDILRRNVSKLGRDFCDNFLSQYDPNNGISAQNNAQQLLNLLEQTARNASGGQSSRISQDQLFAWLGEFIEKNYQNYASAMQNRGGGGGGFGFNQGGFGGSPMGGGFGMQQRSNGFGMGGGFGSTGGFGQGPRPPVGSSFGDVVEPGGARPQQTQTPAPQQPAQSFTTQSAFAPMTSTQPAVAYSSNPLDEVSEGGVEFRPVSASLDWGGIRSGDNRIVVARRDELKTTSAKFTVNHVTAFHQYIQNDPMDVVRDFFAVVPDTTLGSPFLSKIIYHHLEILDLPTAEFLDVRNKCIEAVRQDRQVILHKQITAILDTMQRGPWKVITSYLVGEVNRALRLAARLSSEPSTYVKIGAFEDLDDLLSSSFVHPFTTLPEGRHKLDLIVGTALWNALVMNTDVMFADDEQDFPTHLIQMSPAFPSSMEGVYPNKFSIPLNSEDSMQQFKSRLNEVELSKKTYLLSRRSVVITNIFGKKVLPQIDDTPKVINTPLSQIINRVMMPYTNINIGHRDVMHDESLMADETNPSEQLMQYYENPEAMRKDEIERYSRIPNVDLPVDQTIFAIQYGVDATKYMKALDVFTTLDETLGKDQTILASKSLKEITITA